jgi:hypothetical protein
MHHALIAAGFVRYWLSAGRGDFELTPHNCERSELYCIFFTGPYKERDPRVGINVVTSSVPNKQGVYAEIKSVDYIQNVHNAMEARDQDAEYGIFVGEDGRVAEGPTNNLSIITADSALRTPPFQECLAGCTIQRIMGIVRALLDAGEEVPGITRVEQVRSWHLNILCTLACFLSDLAVHTNLIIINADKALSTPTLEECLTVCVIQRIMGIMRVARRRREGDGSQQGGASEGGVPWSILCKPFDLF